jgi:glycogen operon protein
MNIVTDLRGSAGPVRHGLHLCGDGADVGVWAPRASALWLCLFDANDASGETRLALPGPDAAGYWRAHVSGLRAGQLYGFRADGEHDVARGLRFNATKLLLDPAAREIVGAFHWRPEHHGYVLGTELANVDRTDNAAAMLKARLAAPLPPLLQQRPRVPREQVVLYEVHAKGFSARDSARAALGRLPAELSGSFAALASPAAIAHFKALGVTTLSLLPVHYRLSEPMLPAGLVNHWGYNTLGFFCPDPRLAGPVAAAAHDTAEATRQFRAMADALHAAGLEVVIDVVFNHTPEGNEWGPTLSMRGLGEADWYWREPDSSNPAATRLANWSACGNTVNVGQPAVADFVLQSLRHWVEAMGVDGFRFDLAAVLGREGPDGAFATGARFFERLRADPVLGQVHLIAEPWDAGPEGYRVGHFPPPFAEWNDRFRDAARAFWLGRPLPHGGDVRPALAEAFDGSPAIYRAAGRAPTASVNFITAHDGFTLADLVSFSRKHNEANGEHNRDGRDDELAFNFGHEGASDDPALVETRRRVRRALLATLALAAGTPMLLAGDELGHSQQGNNNAWNQDNELGWLDWAARAQPGNAGLAAWVGELLALRRESSDFAPADWRHLDEAGRWAGLPGADGLDAEAPLTLRRGRWLLLFHPGTAPRRFTPPPPAGGGGWRLRLDSTGTWPAGGALPGAFELPAHSLLVLEPS